MKDVVAPLSIVMLMGSVPRKTVRTGELIGVILLKLQLLIGHLQ